MNNAASPPHRTLRPPTTHPGTDTHHAGREDLARPAAIGSRFARHCEGYFAGGSTNHLLGIALKVAIVKRTLPCPGSTLLDEINAFDLAEAQGANLGQLNMITVSSFCGPQGLIWGYDVCAPEEGHRPIGTVSRGGQHADVYDLKSLTRAFERLVGTVDDPRFPFMAGAHVPAAMKVRSAREPGVLYAALALGIPERRQTDACLLMENPGFWPDPASWSAQREAVLNAMAASVLAVGENQRVRYGQVFVGLASAEVGEGTAACALAVAPYFRLAGDAFVPGTSLAHMSLEAWESATRERFAHAAT